VGAAFGEAPELVGGEREGRGAEVVLELGGEVKALRWRVDVDMVAKLRQPDGNEKAHQNLVGFQSTQRRGGRGLEAAIAISETLSETPPWPEWRRNTAAIVPPYFLRPNMVIALES